MVQMSDFSGHLTWGFPMWWRVCPPLNVEIMMRLMRAKMQVGSVFPNRNAEGKTASEQVTFHGVSKSDAYPADGLDENNSFARWSPSVNLTMTIANPALFGALKPGDTFYVDFTPAE